MKSLLGLVLLAVVALVSSSVSHAQQNQSNTPLNNAAVVKLAKAGFKDKTIISIISVRVPNFVAGADDRAQAQWSQRKGHHGDVSAPARLRNA